MTKLLNGKSGYCNTADMVAEGLIASSMAPEGWHGLCRFCGQCPCHEGVDPLTVCKDCMDQGDGVAEGKCTDREACAGRVRTQLLGNDKAQRLNGIREAAEKSRASKERVRKTAAGRCEHCGEPTAGGRFQMGHDMKLKSLLWTKVRDQSIPVALRRDDLAEMLARGGSWAPGWIKDLPYALYSQATARIDGTGEDFLQRRIKERIG